jgi:hypothetical protein
LWRGLRHAGDHDDNHDGIPDAAGLYGIYYSYVSASGVDQKAPGATYTAVNGHSNGDFDGVLETNSNIYRGRYELAIGGLQGEASLWRQPVLRVEMITNATASDYYYTAVQINDLAAKDLEITPGKAVTNDIAYCFSEVCIRFRSSTNFFNPRVDAIDGAFNGRDACGRDANYSVWVNVAYGTPVYPHQATNTGLVRLYLPQGRYSLRPYINPADSSGSVVPLEPIDLEIGGRQRICLGTEIQMNLVIPACSPGNVMHLAGSVRTGANRLTRIEYVLNGAAPVVLCSDCGTNPSFQFTVTLTSGENLLAVTAYDEFGAVSSVTGPIRADTTPPVIQCPAAITRDCTEPDGAQVNFTVNATDDCDTDVTVTCTPASGSLFPPGANTVLCTATDAAGHTSQCSFPVTVRPPPLEIERAVIVRFGCGVLQGASDINGPWTDIPGATSPYCVPASQARKFYRARN